MKRLVVDELPEDNRIILSFILKFLNEVSSIITFFIVLLRTIAHLPKLVLLLSRIVSFKVLELISRPRPQVTLEAESNLMTAINLSVVFGPNLLWNKSESTLASINHVNNAILTLIGDYSLIFGV